MATCAECENFNRIDESRGTCFGFFVVPVKMDVAQCHNDHFAPNEDN